MCKKVTSVLLVLSIIMTLFSTATTFAATSTNNSRQLMVSGNQLVYVDDPSTAVRLTGVNIAGGEWTGTPGVERLTRSTIEAINNWNCNFLRVPVSRSGWYGDYSYVADGGKKYREYIDSVIDIASDAGVYVILDFHHYKAFDNAQYLSFWQDAAVRYKNNPTVFFGILNEPHGISWDVWRNGDGNTITGHQQVVEMIRDLGAKNIIVAGGLDWAYNLKGIAEGYALVDQGSGNDASKSGYGIMYDSHIYPWKGRTSNWNGSVGPTRKLYPVVIGECGWDAETNKAVGGKTYAEGDVMYHDKWVPELLNWMDDADTYGAAAHYTAYSFHPSSAPRMLGDKDNWKDDANYKYPPTDFWGVYVKAHLAKCESERKEGVVEVTAIDVINPITDYYKNNEIDLSEGNLAVTYSDGSTVEIALTEEGVEVTGFDSSSIGTNTVTVSYKGLTTTYQVNIKEFSQWAATATFDSGSYITFASNAFDIRWAGQTSEDTIKKVSATGEGLDGSNGLGFDYVRTGTWGGVQTATVPATWNWSKTKYISFYAKIIPTTGTSTKFGLNVGGTSAKCNFTATTDWQYFSFNLSDKDLTAATQLQWTVNSTGAGKLVVDNLTISNYEIAEGETPVTPDPDEVVVTSITANAPKTAYVVGEDFVEPTVTGTFSDGSSKLVAASFSGYNMDTPGTYTVTALYQDTTTTYTITVESAIFVKTATFDADADIVFANNAFDIRWAGQNSTDKISKTAANGEGLDGTNGLGFNYARTGTWGGVQTATVPDTWNWERTKYISLYAKILPTTDNNPVKFGLNIADTSVKCNFEVTTDWQFFSFDLSDKDLSTATKLQWTQNSNGAGKLIVDNLTISNYQLDEGEVPEPSPEPEPEPEPVVLSSIAVSGQKTTYTVGDAFVKPTVTAKYSDGTTKTVTATFAGYNMNVAGTQTVTVTFEGKTTTYKITVEEKAPVVTLTSIKVSDVKSAYEVGDAFVKPTVTAVYSDGTTKTVEAAFAGYDMNNAGTYTVTVTFEDKTASFVITVEEIEAPVPEVPADGPRTYLDLDFEDAVYQVVDGVENTKIIETTNKATGAKYQVNLHPNNSARYYRIYSDSTTYIAPNGRKQNCAYDFRLEQPVDDAENKVYVDMRIKRVSYALDDPCSVVFTDDAGNVIFYINYTQANIPTLVAAQTYGVATPESSKTDVTYPCEAGWRCVRAIIDFETSTFQLYQGADFDNMTGFVDGTDTFSFKSAATNLGRITNYGVANRKGSLGFDDIKVYTVADEEPATKVYVQQNFDDAVLDVADYITNTATGEFSVPKGTHITVNAMNYATGENLPWYTYNASRDVTSSGFYYAPNAIGAYEDGTINYALMPADRKRQARAYVTMDTFDADGNKTAAPINDEGKKTVISMRIRRYRADLDDPVTLTLSDIYGDKIFSIVYKQNLYPQLVADATYGGEDKTATSVANYPFNSEWMYLKAEIDFEAKAFKLYVGNTQDDMMPYITGIDSYGFTKATAANFYKLTMDYKGSLGIDDFTVYTE